MAARHSKTWWRRVAILAVGLLIFSFAYLGLRQWASVSMIGRQLSAFLTGFSMVYALLCGPAATVDCLSRERREGTLGLLFLTDLRSYDIVFGKMVATSLDLVLGLAAALPLAAFPFLFGGLSLFQFFFAVMGLLHIMFLSLAVGVCASSFFASGRLSLAVTIFFLAFLTLGLPLIGEEVLHLPFNSGRAAWFYSICPLYTMRLCLEGILSRSTGSYWLNLAGLHSLAWICLLIACKRVRHVWRDEPGSGLLQRWEERFRQWSKGSVTRQAVWRRKMLERNPFAWLDARDRSESTVLWALFLVSTAIWFLGYLDSPRKWTDDGLILLWAGFSQYVLCLWIAIRAPRRLADDKQSGALELLLCTTLKPAEIIRGAMLILRRRFGWVLLGMVALDVTMLNLYWYRRPSTQSLMADDLFRAAVFGLPVFSIQAYCMGRIGLYQGLVSANSLRATFMLIWKAGFLPWMLFVGFMTSWALSLDLGLKFLPRITDTAVFGVWALAHLIPCAVFLARANIGLRNFRSLAARTARVPWWKFWRRSD